MSACKRELGKAVTCLQKGGVIAFPTDTLYGLGADIRNEAALRRVFDIKGRPEQMALPVLVSSWQQALTVADGIPAAGCRLAEHFWPGPLTLVVNRSPGLSHLVTGGRDTVAIRQPDHWVPLRLAEAVGPITGTSANFSGGPELLNVDSIEAQLGPLVDHILRCGPPPRGTSSTVVDVTSGTPRLIREGALPFGEVLQACVH